MAECNTCGEAFSERRAALGYKTCPPCGDKQARAVTRTVAPLSKSNYVLITDPRDLRGLNPKTPR